VTVHDLQCPNRVYRWAVNYFPPAHLLQAFLAFALRPLPLRAALASGPLHPLLLPDVAAAWSGLHLRATLAAEALSLDLLFGQFLSLRRRNGRTSGHHLSD